MIGQSLQTLNPDSTTSQHIDKVYSLAPQVNPGRAASGVPGADLAFNGQFTSFTHADANSSDPSSARMKGAAWLPTRRSRCRSCSRAGT